MADLTVSANVDTFLQSADFAAMKDALGLGTANSPTFTAETLTGQSLTGSQATPLLDLATTWNTTGTPSAIHLDVTDNASNAASLLMNLKVGGTSKFKIDKLGAITTPAPGFNVPWLTVGSTTVTQASGIIYSLNAGGGFGASIGNSNGCSILDGGVRLGAGASLEFGGAYLPGDVKLKRDTAAVLALRNSTNAQTFRVYGTESSSLANYVRASLSSSTTAVTLAAESAGTGAANLDLLLGGKGTTGGVAIDNVDTKLKRIAAANIGVYAADGTTLGTFSAGALITGSLNSTVLITAEKIESNSGDGSTRVQIGNTSGHVGLKLKGAAGQGILLNIVDASNVQKVSVEADYEFKVATHATFSNATVKLTALPTSDPTVAGQLWNNSGVVTVSAG